jgi:Winged helix-turn-helix domain (DUF2582)
MEADIGDAAGTIWQYLDKHGETTLSSIRRRVKLSEQMVLMAIGWLAREGKLSFIRTGRAVKIDLRERRAPIGTADDNMR